MASDAAERIAFLERFKADIQAHFNGADGDATRSRINRGMKRARDIVGEAGVMKTVTLSPPPAVGGLIVRDADPFSFILQDYYGMSMAPTVADMIEQAIGILESPEYAHRKAQERLAAKIAVSADSSAAKLQTRSADDVGPEPPVKVTLSWLVRHVPISFWFWLVGIVGAAFAAGMKAAPLFK